MNTPDDWFEPEVVSRQVTLLQQLVGQKLTKLVRFSSASPEAWARPDPDLNDNEPLLPHEVFSFAAGPLLLGVATGLEVAFGLSDHLEIILDAQRLPNGRISEYQFADDPEWFKLDAADSRFCRPEIHQMLGKRILDVTSLRIDGGPYGEGRSLRVGLVLYVENCPELVLSGNLTEGRDDFAVTLRKEILPEYRKYLTEERLWAPQR